MESGLNKTQMNEEFYGRFQQAVREIEEQLNSIKSAPPGSKGVSIASDQCLTLIAQLSSDVRDANAYLPAHDQRSYSDTIRALQSSLSEARISAAPSSRFKFKKKALSAVPLPSTFAKVPLTAEANEDVTALENVMQYKDQSSPNISSEVLAPESFETVMGRDDRPHSIEDLPAVLSEPGRNQIRSIRRLISVGSTTTSITLLQSAYATLSENAEQTISAVLLRDLQSCFVDTSKPSRRNPFNTMTMKSVSHSIIICGRILGPLHVTGLKNCVVAVSCNQFRMHECSGCQVYLACASNPVVEHCENVQFAPLPEALAAITTRPDNDKWDQVEDFGWLRPEPSPNWSVIRANERITYDVWSRYLRAEEELDIEDLSLMFGITHKK